MIITELKIKNLKVRISEFEELIFDKNILPIFTTPAILKEVDAKKINKYKIETLNSQKKLTFKIITFNEIIEDLAFKFNKIAINLEPFYYTDPSKFNSLDYKVKENLPKSEKNKLLRTKTKVLNIKFKNNNYNLKILPTLPKSKGALKLLEDKGWDLELLSSKNYFVKYNFIFSRLIYLRRLRRLRRLRLFNTNLFLYRSKNINRIIKDQNNQGRNLSVLNLVNNNKKISLSHLTSTINLKNDKVKEHFNNKVEGTIKAPLNKVSKDEISNLHAATLASITQKNNLNNVISIKDSISSIWELRFNEKRKIKYIYLKSILIKQKIYSIFIKNINEKRKNFYWEYPQIRVQNAISTYIQISLFSSIPYTQPASAKVAPIFNYNVKNNFRSLSNRFLLNSINKNFHFSDYSILLLFYKLSNGISVKKYINYNTQDYEILMGTSIRGAIYKSDNLNKGLENSSYPINNFYFFKHTDNKLKFIINWIGNNLALNTKFTQTRLNKNKNNNNGVLNSLGEFYKNNPLLLDKENRLDFKNIDDIFLILSHKPIETHIIEDLAIKSSETDNNNSNLQKLINNKQYKLNQISFYKSNKKKSIVKVETKRKLWFKKTKYFKNSSSWIRRNNNFKLKKKFFNFMSKPKFYIFNKLPAYAQKKRKLINYNKKHYNKKISWRWRGFNRATHGNFFNLRGMGKFNKFTSFSRHKGKIPYKKNRKVFLFFKYKYKNKFSKFSFSNSSYNSSFFYRNKYKNKTIVKKYPQNFNKKNSKGIGGFKTYSSQAILTSNFNLSGINFNNPYYNYRYLNNNFNIKYKSNTNFNFFSSSSRHISTSNNNDTINKKLTITNKNKVTNKIGNSLLQDNFNIKAQHKFKNEEGDNTIKNFIPFDKLSLNILNLHFNSLIYKIIKWNKIKKLAIKLFHKTSLRYINTFLNLKFKTSTIKFSTASNSSIVTSSYMNISNTNTNKLTTDTTPTQKVYSATQKNNSMVTNKNIKLAKKDNQPYLTNLSNIPLKNNKNNKNIPLKNNKNIWQNLALDINKNLKKKKLTIKDIHASGTEPLVNVHSNSSINNYKDISNISNEKNSQIMIQNNNNLNYDYDYDFETILFNKASHKSLYFNYLKNLKSFNNISAWKNISSLLKSASETNAMLFWTVIKLYSTSFNPMLSLSFYNQFYSINDILNKNSSTSQIKFVIIKNKENSLNSINSSASISSPAISSTFINSKAINNNSKIGTKIKLVKKKNNSNKKTLFNLDVTNKSVNLPINYYNINLFNPSNKKKMINLLQPFLLSDNLIIKDTQAMRIKINSGHNKKYTESIPTITPFDFFNNNLFLNKRNRKRFNTEKFFTKNSKIKLKPKSSIDTGINFPTLNKGAVITPTAKIKTEKIKSKPVKNKNLTRVNNLNISHTSGTKKKINILDNNSISYGKTSMNAVYSLPKDNNIIRNNLEFRRRFNFKLKTNWLNKEWKIVGENNYKKIINKEFKINLDNDYRFNYFNIRQVDNKRFLFLYFILPIFFNTLNFSITHTHVREVSAKNRLNILRNGNGATNQLRSLIKLMLISKKSSTKNLFKIKNINIYSATKKNNTKIKSNLNTNISTNLSPTTNINSNSTTTQFNSRKFSKYNKFTSLLAYINNYSRLIKNINAPATLVGKSLLYATLRKKSKFKKINNNNNLFINKNLNNLYSKVELQSTNNNKLSQVLTTIDLFKWVILFLAQSLAPLKRKNNLHSLLFFNILKAKKFFNLSKSTQLELINFTNLSQKENKYVKVKSGLIKELIKDSDSDLFNNTMSKPKLIKVENEKIINNWSADNSIPVDKILSAEPHSTEENKISGFAATTVNTSTTISKLNLKNINSNFTDNFNDSAIKNISTNENNISNKNITNKIVKVKDKNIDINYDFIFNQVAQILEKKKQQNRLISYFTGGRKISDWKNITKAIWQEEYKFNLYYKRENLSLNLSKNNYNPNKKISKLYSIVAIFKLWEAIKFYSIKSISSLKLQTIFNKKILPARGARWVEPNVNLELIISFFNIFIDNLKYYFIDFIINNTDEFKKIKFINSKYLNYNSRAKSYFIWLNQLYIRYNEAHIRKKKQNPNYKGKSWFSLIKPGLSYNINKFILSIFEHKNSYAIIKKNFLGFEDKYTSSNIYFYLTLIFNHIKNIIPNILSNKNIAVLLKILPLNNYNYSNKNTYLNLVNYFYLGKLLNNLLVNPLWKLNRVKYNKPLPLAIPLTNNFEIHDTNTIHRKNFNKSNNLTIKALPSMPSLNYVSSLSLPNVSVSVSVPNSSKLEIYDKINTISNNFKIKVQGTAMDHLKKNLEIQNSFNNLVNAKSIIIGKIKSIKLLELIDKIKITMDIAEKLIALIRVADITELNITNKKKSRKIYSYKYLNKKNIFKPNRIKILHTIKGIKKDFKFEKNLDSNSLSNLPISLLYYSNLNTLKHNHNNLKNKSYLKSTTNFTTKKNKLEPVLSSYLRELSIYNRETKGIMNFYSKIVGYNFNYNTNKISSSVYEYLAAAFLRMRCFISKPVFIITPDKVSINLFYYLLVDNKSDLIRAHRKIKQIKRKKKKGINFRLSNYWFKFLNYLNNKRFRRAKIFYFNSLNDIFPNRLNLLCLSLNKIFNKPVEFNLTRVHFPSADANILVQLMGTIINKVKLPKILRIAYAGSKIKDLNKYKTHNNNDLSIFPAFLTGLNIQIAGRVMTQNMRPRFTVYSQREGISANGKINFLNFARLTSKNKRGSYSITISAGQNYFKY